MDAPAVAELLRRRLDDVEGRIAAACARAGRDPAAVALVAVTKKVPAEVVRVYLELGRPDVAENRPQELWRKAAALADAAARWHLVGHLQRNKVAQTLPVVALTHAVDSVRLLAEVEKESARRRVVAEVLLEVNASGEAAKQGFAPADVPGLAGALAGLRWVRVRGLMTMAAFEDDPERCRPTFALLRATRDRLQVEVGEAHRLDHLSMGMSNDYAVAVEEGATLVRLGTALFEGLQEGA